MPHPLVPGVPHRPAPACAHVVPPSVERQMPPGACVSPLANVVAITTLTLFGANFTSAIRNGLRPSRWAHVVPPSAVRNNPPLSDAAMTVSSSPGFTAIDTVLPPHLVRPGPLPAFSVGWNSVSAAGGATTAGAAEADGAATVDTIATPTTTPLAATVAHATQRRRNPWSRW